MEYVSEPSASAQHCTTGTGVAWGHWLLFPLTIHTCGAECQPPTPAPLSPGLGLLNSVRAEARLPLP